MSIGTIVSGISAAVSSFFTWKSSPVQQRRAAESDAKKAASETEDKARTIEAEVNTGDKDSVNARLGKILPVVAFLLIVGAGCATAPKPVYVPADRACYPTTNEVGTAGWFVPNATFTELLKSAQRAHDLEIKLDATSTFTNKE